MDGENAYLRGATEIFAFSSGRPNRPVFQTAETRHIASRQRYDYWVETQIRHIAMAPPTAAQRRDFHARVTSLANTTMEVHYAESDAITAQRTPADIRRNPSDEVALFLLLDGRLDVALDNDALRIGPNDIFLYDADRPQQLKFSNNRLIQFDVCRRRLSAACGGNMPNPQRVVDALRRSGLTQTLRLQLRQFPSAYFALTPNERMAMQSITESLALNVISAALSAGDQNFVRAHDLVAAARRCIHRRLDDPEFTVISLARSLGCSRATLYRAFKATGTPIASYIREQRLQRLHQLLRNPLERRPLAVLAPLCGLYDTPNVSQMFRKRFGIAPSALRCNEINLRTD